MKVLKRVFLGLLLLIVALLGIGLLLPAEFKVARSVTIEAPAATVYGLIADPREWKNWSVWNERDPQMQMQYSGPAVGEGAKWDWQSATEGNGSMVFTRAQPDAEIAYSLSFPDMGMNSGGVLSLAPAGSGITLTWTNEGRMGLNPINRWFGLFMDRLVGPDFQAGLDKLKRVAEAKAKLAVDPQNLPQM